VGARRRGRGGGGVGREWFYDVGISKEERMHRIQRTRIVL
jgi:hypothetical protein